MALNLAVGHTHARLGLAHWAIPQTLAENPVRAQGWSRRGQSIQQTQMPERMSEQKRVSNLESLLITLKLDLVTAPITGDDLIQFRKYGTLRAVGGELRRNTLMCLVAISSQELIHHLHWWKENLLEAGTPVFLNQSSIQAEYCMAKSTDQAGLLLDWWPAVGLYAGYLNAPCLSFVILQVLVLGPGRLELSQGKDALATFISSQFTTKCWTRDRFRSKSV